MIERCHTCKNVVAEFWGWTHPCLFCEQHVCGEVVKPKGSFVSSTCYVKHTAEVHPEQYALLPADPVAK